MVVKTLLSCPTTSPVTSNLHVCSMEGFVMVISVGTTVFSDERGSTKINGQQERKETVV